MRRKILTFANVTIIISMIIGGVFITSKIESEMIMARQNKIQTLVDSIAISSQSLIWNYDTVSLQSIIDRLQQDNEIDHLIFMNEKSESIFNLEDIDKILSRTQYVEKDIVKDDNRIGSVRIVYNDMIVKKNVEETIVVVSVALISIVVVLSIVIIIIVNRSLFILKSAINELKMNSKVTRTQSEELGLVTDKVAQNTVAEAGAIQQTVATLTQVLAMVERSAEFAEKTNGKAEQSYSFTNEGKQQIEQTKNFMQSFLNIIHETFTYIENNSKNMDSIIGVIKEISQKTQMINDVVFQTRLLSFNASVEAARAGEGGKGFAVVAEEVGNLALTSGNAAREISELLEKSINDVQVMAETTKSHMSELVVKGDERANNINEMISLTNETFSKVVSNADEVKSMMSELSHSATEQLGALSEINHAMNSLDTNVQENSSSAQVGQDGAKRIKKQSYALDSIIDRIIEIFDGKQKVRASSTKRVDQTRKLDNIASRHRNESTNQKVA